MSTYPDDLLYTAQHEWLRIGEDAVTVGISSYAAEALGDIVYVSLPEAGSEVTAGTAFGEVESTKSVSDVYAPVSGHVVARNEALDSTPELVNGDPYGEGWLIRIQPAAGQAVARDGLLTAADYGRHTTA